MESSRSHRAERPPHYLSSKRTSRIRARSRQFGQERWLLIAISFEQKGICSVSDPLHGANRTLAVRPANGKYQVVLGVAAIALARDGGTVEHKAEHVEVTFPEDVLRHGPDPIAVDQQIDLSKGDKFLRLSVWDTVSGRFGTIDMPLEVPKPGK